MKRVGYLFEKICDKENIRAAIMCASKRKRNRRDVRRVLDDIDHYIDIIHDSLADGTFVPNDYQTATIEEGLYRKARVIFKPRFYPDQIVHWAIYLVIRPILNNSLCAHSCGSIPLRGVHYGKKYVERWCRGDRKNTKYYLKMDITKYYPSVNLDVLLEKLEHKIKDKRLLDLIALILSKSDGLPIGMLLSQIFANYYLCEIDHHIKEELGAAHYIRYMDDMVVFGRNKKRLHAMVEAITEMLSNIGLRLKGNWQVCRLSKEMLDFMGFRFDHYKTTLRKSVMLRISRKVRRVFRKGKRASPKDACGVISYLGWIRHSDSYGLFCKWIKPFLRIGILKNIVRRYQNEINQKSKRVCPA